MLGARQIRRAKVPALAQTSALYEAASIHTVGSLHRVATLSKPESVLLLRSQGDAISGFA